MNNSLFTLRSKFGLSQKEVAEKIGVTTSHYGMIEIGKRTPSLIVAYKLSKFFRTTIENIFFNT